MADERDPKVSQRYRELGGEEPSRELDQAILAAAHRAADKPHAPLVTPAGRHRWYFSLAAAAIVVLAVAVTWHIERQQPDEETLVMRQDVPAKKEDVPPPKPRPGFTPDPAPKIQQAPAKPAPDAAAPAPAQAESRIRENATGDVARAEPSAQAERREASPAAGALSGGMNRTQPQAAAAPVESAAPRDAARSRATESSQPEPPERWLERIVQLRKEGKHDEADKALAEFKKRYPDYAIPQAMRESVEKK
jgi:hypothetical protein